MGSAGTGVTASGTTIGQVDDFTGSCSGLGAGAADVAIEWTAPDSGTYSFSTNVPGTNYDTVLYVLDGTCTTELGCDNDTGGAQSEVVTDLRAGQRVVVVVDGFDGAEGNYVLDISQL